MIKSGATPFLVLAVLCPGCGTIINSNWAEGGASLPYGGVILDYGMGTGKELGCGPWWFLDMPFSLAGDTLLLPINTYDYYQIRPDPKATTNRQPEKP